VSVDNALPHSTAQHNTHLYQVNGHEGQSDVACNVAILHSSRVPQLTTATQLLTRRLLAVTGLYQYVEGSQCAIAVLRLLRAVVAICWCAAGLIAIPRACLRVAAAEVHSVCATVSDCKH
jgi:hypothetical protein